MSALLPFWLLIAPPLVLLVDSMVAKNGTSAMGARTGTVRSPVGTSVPAGVGRSPVGTGVPR